MAVCRECKTQFQVYPALKDHFRLEHRAKFVAICLWLGPELDKRSMLDDWWFYELRFTRQQLDGRIEEEEKHVVNG